MKRRRLNVFRWESWDETRQQGQWDVLQTIWRLTQDPHLEVRFTPLGLELTARRGALTKSALMRWRDLDSRTGDPLQLAFYTLRDIGVEPHREIREWH